MVLIESITKHFGVNTALDSVSLTVSPGCIYGLVGTNGSGKSTLLRLISGVYSADGGQVTVDGEPVFENPEQKQKIFFVSDDLFFPPQATVDDMRQFYRAAYPRWDEARYQRLLELFPIGDRRKLSSFSKGMRRQAALILALSCAPEYLPRETRTGSLAEAEYVNGRAEWDEEYYHAASNTILTESYRNTLALLRELGAAQAIENNWSDVKAAYVLPFNREYDSRTITQTDLNRVAQTRDDLEDFLNPENRYEGAEGLNMQSFALSKMELNALRSELTSTALNYGEPFAVIGIAAGEEIEEMTGYYLVPVSALPEHLKQAVAQMVRGYYGTYAVESWGYGNVGVTWVATESVA